MQFGVIFIDEANLADLAFIQDVSACGFAVGRNSRPSGGKGCT